MSANIFKSYQDSSYMIEFNVIYSEVYQMPTLYFIITNLELNKLISFDEYLKQSNTEDNFFYKNYEVSKVVHIPNLESSL